MAYRRSITARAKLLYQQQRVAPSFSHIHRDDDDCENTLDNNPVSKNAGIPNYFLHRLYGNGNNLGTIHGSRNLSHDRRFSIPAAYGSIFMRNMSSLGEGSSDKIEIMTDMADVLGDKVVEVAPQVGPVVNEVAVAAADSFFPLAALQYLIDYVHSFTGLNWWASIVLTTILIRGIQLPLMINQMKATSKFNRLTPQLKEVQDEMLRRNSSPAAVDEALARTQELFKEHGVTPFTPLKGDITIALVFCCFFFAIKNMAVNVASFKDGGTLWFTDLTTPDSMMIFPILAALTFCMTAECNAQEGLEGNPHAGTIKTVRRVFAALTVPITSTFPKAFFCYWITSNLFSLAYGLVLKKPEVKKFLGMPIILAQPPSTDKKPGLPFFEALNKYAAAQKQQSPSSPSETSSKPANTRISSSSVLNQRIKTLKKEVKGRKKGRKADQRR